MTWSKFTVMLLKGGVPLNGDLSFSQWMVVPHPRLVGPQANAHYRIEGSFDFERNKEKKRRLWPSLLTLAVQRTTKDPTSKRRTYMKANA